VYIDTEWINRKKRKILLVDIATEAQASMFFCNDCHLFFLQYAFMLSMTIMNLVFFRSLVSVFIISMSAQRLL
jgi:hypothetical protein